jgi:hypothetical protein
MYHNMVHKMVNQQLSSSINCHQSACCGVFAMLQVGSPSSAQACQSSWNASRTPARSIKDPN